MSLCDQCRGACCEDLAIGLEGLPPNRLEFLTFRGIARQVVLPDGRAIHAMLIPHRCQHLTPDGRCDAYDQRPQVCRDFEEQGPTCRAVIRRRRPQGVN